MFFYKRFPSSFFFEKNDGESSTTSSPTLNKRDHFLDRFLFVVSESARTPAKSLFLSFISFFCVKVSPDAKRTRNPIPPLTRLSSIVLAPWFKLPSNSLSLRTVSRRIESRFLFSRAVDVTSSFWIVLCASENGTAQRPQEERMRCTKKTKV